MAFLREMDLVQIFDMEFTKNELEMVSLVNDCIQHVVLFPLVFLVLVCCCVCELVGGGGARDLEGLA